jgi:hypothetical protein
MDRWRVSKSQTGLAGALVGPYGLHAVLGLVLALFAGFLFVSTSRASSEPTHGFGISQ